MDERRLVIASGQERWVALVRLDLRHVLLCRLPFEEEWEDDPVLLLLERPSPSGRYVTLAMLGEKMMWEDFLYVWMPSTGEVRLLGNRIRAFWSPTEEQMAFFRREWVEEGYGYRLHVQDLTTG